MRAALAVATAPLAARAQASPTKPIRIVVPFPPGGLHGELGAAPVGGSPGSFEAVLRRSHAGWKSAIVKTGVRAE